MKGRNEKNKFLKTRSDQYWKAVNKMKKSSKIEESQSTEKIRIGAGK